VSGECLEQPANANASNVSAITDVCFFIFSSQTTKSHKSCAPRRLTVRMSHDEERASDAPYYGDEHERAPRHWLDPFVMRWSLQSRSGLFVKKRRIVQREHSMIHPRGKLEIPTVSKRSHPQCGQTMLFPPARYFCGPIASFAARMPLLTAVVNLLIKYFFRCTAHNEKS